MRHYSTCDAYNSVINKLTKDVLHKEYVELTKSISEIEKDFNLQKLNVVKSKLIEYEIPIRTVKERANTPRRKELTKETCIIKYGTEHHLMSSDVIHKRETTILSRHGVHNTFQRKDIIEKIQSKNNSQLSLMQIRREQSWLERYGYDNPWKIPEVIDRIKTKKFESGKQGRQFSLVSQQLFWKIFHRLPVHLQSDVYFSELNKEYGKKTHDGYLFFDFVVPSLKYCLEYNGTYYHADPRVYKPTWFNKRMKKTAHEIWEVDAKKLNFLRDLGFRVDVFWQLDDHDAEVDRVVKLLTELDEISQVSLRSSSNDHLVVHNTAYLTLSEE